MPRLGAPGVGSFPLPSASPPTTMESWPPAFGAMTVPSSSTTWEPGARRRAYVPASVPAARRLVVGNSHIPGAMTSRLAPKRCVPTYSPPVARDAARGMERARAVPTSP